MFHLESSIAHWREQMSTVGIGAAALNELESHLREEIGRQIRLGKSEAEAFKISARQIGRPEILRCEFHKNEAASSKRIGTVIVLAGAMIILRILVRYGEMGYWKSEQLEWLLAGAAMILFGLGTAFFNIGLGETRDIRLWKLVGITYSLFAVWISLLPVCSILTVPKLSAGFGLTDRALVLTAIAVSALSVFGWRLGCRALPIIRSRPIRNTVGIAGCLLGPISVAIYLSFILPQSNRFPLAEFFLAWTGMAILGGAGYGLTEAARIQITTADVC
jgi:hypothetical protein